MVGLKDICSKKVVIYIFFVWLDFLEAVIFWRCSVFYYCKAFETVNHQRLLSKHKCYYIYMGFSSTKLSSFFWWFGLVVVFLKVQFWGLLYIILSVIIFCRRSTTVLFLRCKKYQVLRWNYSNSVYWRMFLFYPEKIILAKLNAVVLSSSQAYLSDLNNFPLILNGKIRLDLGWYDLFLFYENK